MKSLFTITILLFTLVLRAETVDTLVIKSKITDVTVFTEGAQVTRHAKEKLINGKHILVFEKLPGEIDAQSIQVNNIENCKILSVKHFLSNGAEKKNKEAEKLIQNKIDDYQFRIKEISARLGVFAIEQKLLLDNSLLSRRNEGSAVADIKEAADYYRLRLTEIKQEELLLGKEIEEINKKIQEQYALMNDLRKGNSTSWSKVFIAVESETELPVDIQFTYFVHSAGWEPFYDFRVDDITKPLNIVYNANIYQSSGEDWNAVNIKLSTSNPTLTGEKPELQNWYVERKISPPQNDLKNGISSLRGRSTDKTTGEPLPFANVIIEQNGIQKGGASTDIDGYYTIKPIAAGTYTIKSSVLGYKPVIVPNYPVAAATTEVLNFEMEATSQNMEAVTITSYKVPLIDKDYTVSGATVTADEIRRMPSRSNSNVQRSVGGVYSADGEVGRVRGQRSDGNVTYIDGIAVTGYGSEQSYADYSQKTDVVITDFIANTLRSNVTNLEYAIEIPYSIPSDGADYAIKIKEAKTPVKYIYYAVPKLDNEVFLIAEIVDWTQLKLLSGKSGIYFQGTFTGESYIDASQVTDTLHVSLGRDNNIIVQREGNKTNERKIIGNSIKETSGWDFTVKNNRNVAVKVVIEDQYPITERKAIEIELIESSGAKVDPKTGKMIWELTLNPDEKKTFSSKYSVKYPRY